MNCRASAAVLAVALAAFPVASRAALIEIESLSRSVTASADHEGPGSGGTLDSNTTTSSSPTGLIQASASSSNPSFPFHRTSASSQQTSTISADEIATTGSGQASATDFMFGFGTYAMGFVYDITFEVTQPATFDFFALASAGFSPFSVSVTLFDPEGIPIFEETGSGAGSHVLSEAGIVDPGSHRFLVSLTRSGSTTEEPGGTGYTLSASLELTAIPEPSSILLLVGGLLGLAGRRRGR